MEFFSLHILIDWRESVLHGVLFVLAFLVAWVFVYRPLFTHLHARRKEVLAGMAERKRAEAVLRDADAKRVEIINAATVEAESIVSRARESARRVASRHGTAIADEHGRSVI